MIRTLVDSAVRHPWALLVWGLAFAALVGIASSLVTR